MICLLNSAICSPGEGMNTWLALSLVGRKGCTRWKTSRWNTVDGSIASVVSNPGILQDMGWRNSRCLIAGATQGSTEGVKAEPSIFEAKPAGRKRSTNGAKSQGKGSSFNVKRAESMAAAETPPEAPAVAHSYAAGDPDSYSRQNISRLDDTKEMLVSVPKSDRQRPKTKTLRPLPAPEEGDADGVVSVMVNGFDEDNGHTDLKQAPSRSNVSAGNGLGKSIAGLLRSPESATGKGKEAGEEDDEGDDEEDGDSLTREDEKSPPQQTTVRMIRLPGGRLVDPRTVKGWVILPDGRKIVCGRCGGRALLRSANEELEDCPACFPFREPEVRRRGPLTPEHRQKISAAHKGRKRKPLGEAHKERISKSMQEVYASGEQQARISASMWGKPKTCTVLWPTWAQPQHMPPS
eukprot:jgi/Botrbrau1/1257/Bobra.0163s0050.1